MAIVNLEMLKKHVRADDFAEDDEYLQYLLSTAETWVLRETRRSVDELIAEGGGVFPLPLKHAMLMIAAHWYNQREAVSNGQLAEVPYTLSALIMPYTKLV